MKLLFPIVLTTLFNASSSASAETPPVFATDLSFQAGVEKSKAEGKLFLLDAMTSWCGPCKAMDRTTWVDEGLVAWMKDNVIAVQLDMDEHAQVRDGLGIKAYPTIVVFKGGVEFDRHEGREDATWMRTWLEDIHAGKTNLDRVRESLETARSEDQSKDLCRKRMRLAGQLLAYGEYEEALTENLWLWEKIPTLAPEHEVRALVESGLSDAIARLSIRTGGAGQVPCAARWV